MKQTKLFSIIALILALVMTLTLFAGCANTDDPNKPSDKIEADSNVNPVGVFPIVKEKITLTMGIRANSTKVTDYIDNDLTKWLEEKTNIHLEFQILPDKDTETKINLLFAGGVDLPDIINVGNIPNNSVYGYALDQLVVNLKPYMKEYGDAYKTYINDCTVIEQSMTAPDGGIYGIPKYNQTLHNMLKFGKMYVYKPWLDKLGMKVPTTVDELYTVLKAFKENDMNGNGKADEIPMAGSYAMANQNPVVGLLSPFIPYDAATSGIQVDSNGKIYAAFMKPEFEAGMKFIQKLVAEKLFEPTSFTMDANQLKQLASRKNEVVLGAYVHPYTAVNASMAERVQDYVCLDLLDTPESDIGGFLKTDLTPNGPSVLITSTCEHKLAAFRLLDFLCSKEFGMRERYGVENRDWEYVGKDNKLETMDGSVAQFEIINDVWTQLTNVLWGSEVMAYHNHDVIYGQGYESGTFNANKWHHINSVEHYEPYVVGTVIPLDSIFFTEEEMADYSLLKTGITDYVKEQIAAFATGNRPMSDWSKFQDEVKKMGLDDYIAFIQKGYDRQYGKK